MLTGSLNSVEEPEDELGDLVAANTEWGGDEIAVLRRMTAQWHVIADLSGADLVLWVRTVGGHFLAAAHVRPSTAPTMFPQHVVGTVTPRQENPVLDKVRQTGGIVAPTVRDVTAWNPDVGVAVPISVGGAHAVMGCYGTPPSPGSLGGLGATRVPVTEALWHMVVEGSFPDPVLAPENNLGSPRLGNGLMVVTPEDVVDHASSNAVAAFYQLGWQDDVNGTLWTSLMSRLMTDTGARPDTGSIPARPCSWQADISARGCTVSVRTLPLWLRRTYVGMLVMVRDVTELRVRERQLMGQEATIREINHRVKNNLQTVSALLRMQRRRIDIPAAQNALTEAIGRVTTMGVVHDMLSKTVDDAVDFDSLIDSGLLLAPTGATGAQVRLFREGAMGTVPAQDATVLALAIHELLANSVEHGFGQNRGTITVSAWRRDHQLRVDVADDGVGCDPEAIKSGNGLGTHIVRSLVRSELGGSISWHRRDPRGTRVRLDVTLRTG